MPNNSNTSPWVLAATLAERSRNVTSALIDPDAAGEAAIRRFTEWRSQPPFAEHDLFQQALASHGTDEVSLLRLLDEHPAALHARLSKSAEWVNALLEAYAVRRSGPDAVSIVWENCLKETPTAVFLTVVEPLIRRGAEEIRRDIHQTLSLHPEAPIDTNTIDSLLLGLISQPLQSIINRVLVLELNVARLRGELSGSTSEQRFQSFGKRLSETSVAMAILEEYPVLARHAVTCVQQWVNFATEIIDHLCVDWAAIRERLLESDPGVLVGITGGAGDRHRGGRCVLTLQFGAGQKLVYKPRSLDVDMHFECLIKWLNDECGLLALQVPKTLSAGDHGWVQFVQQVDCRSTQEICAFYERTGQFIALLRALGASDFHAENLIAAGAYPILIDLEALFCPQFGSVDRQAAEGRIGDYLESSVLAGQLLPQRFWASQDDEGVDHSGIGGHGGQITPFKVPVWEAAGGDAMRLVRKRVEMPGSFNQPTLDGQPVNPVEYRGAIATGFTSMYRTLAKSAELLTSEDGPLADFSDDETRVVLRNTQTYGSLLRESYHPDVLRDALDRDRLLDRLWQQVPSIPHLAKVIAAEREAMHQGDIPLFTTRPGSQHLWSASGMCFEKFFEESGLAAVRRRIEAMCEEDLERQLWIIRSSMATLSTGADGGHTRSHQLTESTSTVRDDDLLGAACAIGDRLDSLAFRGDKDASWLGLTMTTSENWTLSPLGLDLYSGLPGIVLFLAYLEQLSGVQRYRRLAEAGLEALRTRVEQQRDSLTAVGVYAGWGGVIYTLTHLSALWQESVLRDEAQGFVSRLPELIEADEQLDIIGGTAGCLMSLLALQHSAPSEHTLSVAMKCGDRLVTEAQTMDRGLAWSTIKGAAPLAGFSHGAAGITTALAELATLTGEARYREAALAGIEYERSLFDEHAKNWADLRSSGGDPAGYTVAWCYGAPGIGLSRIKAQNHLADLEIRDELLIAVATTLERGLGRGHCLCHGDLGNLEFLAVAGDALNDGALKDRVRRLAGGVLRSADAHGWFCGVPDGVETPGLMIGLAGMGYGLLRLAHPRAVPSVLTIEPPK